MPPQTKLERKTPWPDQRVTYPFPLRPGVVVELRIPRTLTRMDYERLCAFLLTLRDDRG